MNSNLRSLEFSYFVQATEDEEKVTRGVREIVGAEAESDRQETEGHFGNKILWISFHLVGEEAAAAFGRMVSKMDRQVAETILKEVDSSVDEHGALFIRLSKQLITKGVLETTSSDPVRVKVKPRQHRGDMASFYSRAFEEAAR